MYGEYLYKKIGMKTIYHPHDVRHRDSACAIHEVTGQNKAAKKTANRPATTGGATGRNNKQ